RFLMRATQAADGVLLVHSHDPARTPPEQFRAYDATGDQLPRPSVPFSRSLAGALYPTGEAKVVQPITASGLTGIEWQDFERGRAALLARPPPAGGGPPPGAGVVSQRRRGGLPRGGP